MYVFTYKQLLILCRIYSSTFVLADLDSMVYRLLVLCIKRCHGDLITMVTSFDRMVIISLGQCLVIFYIRQEDCNLLYIGTYYVCIYLHQWTHFNSDFVVAVRMVLESGCAIMTSWPVKHMNNFHYFDNCILKVKLRIVPMCLWWWVPLYAR